MNKRLTSSMSSMDCGLQGSATHCHWEDGVRRDSWIACVGGKVKRHELERDPDTHQDTLRRDPESFAGTATHVADLATISAVYVTVINRDLLGKTTRSRSSPDGL